MHYPVFVETGIHSNERNSWTERLGKHTCFFFYVQFHWRNSELFATRYLYLMYRTTCTIYFQILTFIDLPNQLYESYIRVCRCLNFSVWSLPFSNICDIIRMFQFVSIANSAFTLGFNYCFLYQIDAHASNNLRNNSENFSRNYIRNFESETSEIKCFIFVATLCFWCNNAHRPFWM